MKFVDRNDDYKKRLNELQEEHGEDFADAIDDAIDLLEGSEDSTPTDLFLAVLFAMPLPYAGAADGLINFLQKEAQQEGS